MMRPRSLITGVLLAVLSLAAIDSARAQFLALRSPFERFTDYRLIVGWGASTPPNSQWDEFTHSTWAVTKKEINFNQYLSMEYGQFRFGIINQSNDLLDLRLNARDFCGKRFFVKCVAWGCGGFAFRFSNLGAQARSLGLQQPACTLELLCQLGFLLNGVLQAFLVLFSQLIDDFAADAFLIGRDPLELLIAPLDF